MNAEQNRFPSAPYGTPQNPWRRPDGSIISCTEKLKVMQENLDELCQCAQEALEDAVLMGCDEDQVKEAFLAAIEVLNSGYTPATSPEAATKTAKPPR
ncbi:MAG: hypothetical protein LBI68_09335 [Azoarcus sp.]|jgi:hypothetical protein|nr:hypothetical protein [Azoarcus sp.]